MNNRVEQWYEYLADEEDARVCTDISDSACREVPQNFFIIFASQFLTRLADALASAKIILPWLLTSVGAPAFFSGMLVPIRESGSLLPQLVIGGFVRRHALRKWYYVAGAALQAGVVVAIAWAGLQLDSAAAGTVIMLLLVLFSLARGLCSVASKDVLGKTIPRSRRGLISGYCASAAGIVTILFGIMLLFMTRPDTDVYAMLLLAGGFCWLAAAVGYSLIREYPGATEGGGNALSQAIASLSLLKTDVPFRLFVLVRCLMMSSGLAAPYFIILARAASDDGALLNLGIFILAGGVADMASGVLWGRLADIDSRRVLLLTAMSTAVICGGAGLLALAGHFGGIWPILLLFFLLSITHQGVRLGRKTYVVDLASGNRRTDYVAVSNSVIGLMLLLVGLAGALLAQLSLAAVLALFAGTSLAALLLGRHLPQVSG
jgi:hypothetical protein